MNDVKCASNIHTYSLHNEGRQQKTITKINVQFYLNDTGKAAQ